MSDEVTVPLGLWIDDTPKYTLSHGYFEGIKDLGISTIAIMVESSKAAWDPTWSLSQISKVCERARALDLEVVLTAWPNPRRSYMAQMVGWMIGAVPLGASGVEVDLEGNWQTNDLDGSIGSLEAASVQLVQDLRELADDHDVRLEVTTHTGHQESSRRALVAPHVDRFVAQAYSVRVRPGGQLVKWDDRRLGPGHHQRWAADDARTVPGVIEGRPALSIGLPLWSQSWPGHEPSEALSAAYRAALEQHPAEIRFWSSKHLLGAVAKPYGRPWLEDLASSF